MYLFRNRTLGLNILQNRTLDLKQLTESHQNFLQIRCVFIVSYPMLTGFCNVYISMSCPGLIETIPLFGSFFSKQNIKFKKT